MQIDVLTNNHYQKLFTQDYYSNPAMANSFQTPTFRCKIQSIELAGNQLHHFIVEEEAQFLYVHVLLTNCSGERLYLYKEDFQIYFDGEGPYGPQDCLEEEDEMQEECILQAEDCYVCKLLFIIPKDTKKIMFTYTEWIDEEYDGKCYKLKYQLP